MAYGNYNGGGQRYGQSRYGQGGYNNGGNFQQQQMPQVPEETPEEFLRTRLEVYDRFAEEIKAQGRDIADYALFLGGWITSYLLPKRK